MILQDMTLEQREAVTSVLLRLNATLADELVTTPVEDQDGFMRAMHTVAVEAGAAMRTLKEAL